MTVKTHFGFTEILSSEKAEWVASVFDSVAERYDLMNDLMSFGLHRYWKKLAVAATGLRASHKVLDLAGGTGDLAKLFSPIVGANGKVVLADINADMLTVGRSRLIDKGFIEAIQYVQADAEELPFRSNYFDCITIAFGLRNVTNKASALRSMYRVLKPGGRLIVLEFSQPVLPLLAKIYDKYSFNIIPKLGEWICNDRTSYQYLVESIRMHPAQAELRDLMITAGFDEVSYHNLSAGIVALHKGIKW